MARAAYCPATPAAAASGAPPARRAVESRMRSRYIASRSVDEWSQRATPPTQASVAIPAPGWAPTSRSHAPPMRDSLQTRQIVNQWLYVIGLDRNGGHVRTWLNRLRIGNPAAEVAF